MDEEEDMRIQTLKDLVKIRDERKRGYKLLLQEEKALTKHKSWEEYSNNIDEDIINLLKELIREEII
jgi:hypothetical protein